MRCLLCNRQMSKPQAEEIGICEKCEIETHGCSTGDCPHTWQVECDKALAELKAEQKFRSAIKPTDQTE